MKEARKAKRSMMPRMASIGAVAACGMLAGAGVTMTAAGRLMADANGGFDVAGAAKPGSAAAARPLSEDEKIVHVLNRLGYGPRPGDVAKVKATGLDKWIDQQLHPESIDDSTVDKRLSSYPLLELSTDKLMGLYRDQVEAYQESQKLRKDVTAEGKQDKMKAADGAAAPPGDTDPQKKMQLALAAATPQERMEMMSARQALMRKALPVRLAQMQFTEAKALRAVASERQLNEVMVDFWTNHFNIDMRKNACGVLKIADDRDVIRKYSLGRFRDLLGASAKSPAMLMYLDNFQSASPNNPMQEQMRRRGARFGSAPPPNRQRNMGINENYGREIMELHTLGVDGGYTQQDVQEVAKCFTGWSVGNEDGSPMQMGKGGKPTLGGTFRFYPARHDNGPKTVLGHAIPAGGGQRDGEMVLDILASSPATMKHVSYQLCQRFVSDTPPDSLVDKCVSTWKKTDGDIREVVRTIVTSKEFYSRDAYRNKIKSPFEFAVSSVRALGGTYADLPEAPNMARFRGNPKQKQGYENVSDDSFVGQVGLMGEPLFEYQAPTGYSEDSQKWVSSGALISRLNFSLALTGGKLHEVGLPNLEQTISRAGGTSQLVNYLAGDILHGDISASTRATLIKQAGSPDSASAASDVTTVSRLAALMLGAPEFQRR